MDTKPEGLSVNGAGIKFRSLSLGGVRGKVRATLSENQVSFESKNGHALDIRLDAIQRVHHHHTTLVPGWLAVVGLIFMWVAWRGVTGKFQAVLGAAGIVMATSHYLTRRPTLTIDTKAKDCHTVFGPDLSMMRLCALIQRIQNGMNLEDAKQSVDNMVSDSEYPRSLNSEEIELLPEPVELFPSPVIGHFMDAMTIDEPLIEIDEIPSPAVVIDDLDLPSIWDEEEESIEQVMPDGLLQRSRENLITRRNNISASGWQPPTHQEQFNQVLRGSPDGGNSYGMIQQHSMQNHSYNSMPQLTPAPTEFLPSFVGAQGAHLPSNPHVFNSPDSPLPNQEPEEEKQSLVASSRRDVPIDAEIIPDEIEPSKERFPKLKQLRRQPVTTKLKMKKGMKRSLTGKSVLSELMAPAAKFPKKFLRRRLRTGDTLRIQAENSRQSQVVESIQNLAKKNGGDVSDEEVEKMMSHINPKPVIPTAFKDLVSTEKSRAETVNSIPRIDE